MKWAASLFQPLPGSSGSFSLARIEVQSAEVEEDVGFETLFVPVAEGLLDQSLDRIVQTFDGSVGEPMGKEGLTGTPKYTGAGNRASERASPTILQWRGQCRESDTTEFGSGDTMITTTQDRRQYRCSAVTRFTSSAEKRGGVVASIIGGGSSWSVSGGVYYGFWLVGTDGFWKSQA
jgi:hypothetical protein